MFGFDDIRRKSLRNGDECKDKVNSKHQEKTRKRLEKNISIIQII